MVTHVKESRILIWRVTMHCNMVSPYRILLSKHENFEKLCILTKSMTLIIMVGSNFLSEALKYLIGWLQINTVRMRVLEWALTILIGTLRFWGIFEPSAIFNQSFNVYFAQILRDSKLRVKIRRNMIQWNSLIKYSIFGFWTILDAFVTPDWLFDVCSMRFGGSPLMRGKIIISQVDVTKLGTTI